MKLLFVGDTHGTTDIGKVAGFLRAAALKPSDALIHCGDIGLAWSGEEDEALRYWRSLPCKVVVCLGNHENYPWVSRQPLVTRYACQGYDLGGRVFAPLAGQVARLGGKSLWFYPGGFSIDYPFRVPGRNVHAQELLETEHSKAIVNKLLKRSFTDYIVSHDGPRSLVTRLFGFPISQPPPSYFKHLNQQEGSRAHPGFALDTVLEQGRFKKWYFGHHHRDVAEGRLRCLWNQAALEDTRSGQTQLIHPE